MRVLRKHRISDSSLGDGAWGVCYWDDLVCLDAESQSYREALQATSTSCRDFD